MSSISAGEGEIREEPGDLFTDQGVIGKRPVLAVLQ